MSAPPRAIIFDKDGTLFDFDRTWGPMTGRMIRQECGGDPARIAALAEVLKFDLARDRIPPGSVMIASTAEDVESVIMPFTADQDAVAFRDRMRAATGAVAQVAVTDLAALFADLSKRGLTLGIATNDSLAPALANLDSAGVRSHFAFIAGCDSGYGSKPAAGQLLAFCDQTGIAPEACVMVGDSLHDLHAGTAAGMTTVGVLTGPAGRDELAPHANVVLPSIGYLPAWLDAH